MTVLYMLMCNGCGVTYPEKSASEELVFKVARDNGWVLDDGDDLCPYCANEFHASFDGVA